VDLLPNFSANYNDFYAAFQFCSFQTVTAKPRKFHEIKYIPKRTYLNRPKYINITNSYIKCIVLLVVCSINTPELYFESYKIART